MTLIDLKKNTPAKIISIDGTETEIKRLYAIGIYRNARILKTQNSRGEHPIWIHTQQQCNFAIGYDLAKKIIIETTTHI